MSKTDLIIVDIQKEFDNPPEEIKMDADTKKKILSLLEEADGLLTSADKHTEIPCSEDIFCPLGEVISNVEEIDT